MSLPASVVQLRGDCLDCVEAITGQQPTDPLGKLAHTFAVRYIRTLKQPSDLEQLHYELVQLAPDSARADVAASAPA